jgi:hypothetical protein
LLVALEKCFLGAFSLVDVLYYRQRVIRVARSVAYQRRSQLHPDYFAVLTDVAFFDGVARNLPGGDPGCLPHVGVVVVGVRDVAHGQSFGFFPRVADDLAEARVWDEDAFLDRGLDDPDVGLLEGGPETLLRFARGPVGAGAFDRRPGAPGGLFDERDLVGRSVPRHALVYAQRGDETSALYQRR